MWTRVTVLAAALLSVVAAPASATTFTGHVDGDGSSGTSGRVITGLDVSYDSAGALTSTATFRGDPTVGAAATVAVHLGTVSGTTCGAPQAIQFVSLAPGSTAVHAATSADTSTDLGGSATYAASSVTLTTSHGALAALPYTCIWAKVASADGNTVYSATDGWETVSGPPDPPAPSTPAPAPSTPATPAPAPTPATPTPAPQTPLATPAPAALLKIDVSGVPEVVKKGRWVTAKIAISNPGQRTTKGIALKVLTPKGVSATPRRVTLKQSLKPGKAKVVKVKVKFTGKAKAPATVSLRATGKGKVAADGAFQLALTKPPKALPGVVKGPLTGRYFWGNLYHVDYAWDNYAIYFSRDGWAYWGFPDSGVPDCSKSQPKLDDKGVDTGDGCMPVTYDAKTGAITIGTHTGTYVNGALTIDEIKFMELVIPAAGSRYQTSLEHLSYRGLCGLITGCSTSREAFTLTSDGGFLESSSSLTTMGDGFSSPFIAAGGYPPDQYGTYEIQAGGTFVRHYANGTTKISTIGVSPDAAGNPDPINEDLLIGETNYYKPSS
jgi:hypothetical protein